MLYQYICHISGLTVILRNQSTVICVLMNHKGHIPYSCVSVVLIKYVLYDNNPSQYI